MESMLLPKYFDILIVDDIPEHIDVAVQVLRDSNFKIRVATDGNTALKLIYQQKPDLILLDIYMPEMDGFELCRLIKNTPDLKNIPVIFLTSFSDEESIRKVLSREGRIMWLSRLTLRNCFKSQNTFDAEMPGRIFERSQ